MAVLTTAQVKQYLQKAGFTGNGLSSGVIIVQRESGNNTLAVNKSDPYGGSYGMWQINGSHIKELFGTAISLADAYDPQASSNYAYELSKHGSDFSDWTTSAGLPVSPYTAGSSTTVSDTTITNAYVLSQKGSGYQYILMYVFVIIIAVLVAKTRIGYVAIYYLLMLVIILLFVTQAQFVADAIVDFGKDIDFGK